MKVILASSAYLTPLTPSSSSLPSLIPVSMRPLSPLSRYHIPLLPEVLLGWVLYALISPLQLLLPYLSKTYASCISLKQLSHHLPNTLLGFLFCIPSLLLYLNQVYAPLISSRYHPLLPILYSLLISLKLPLLPYHSKIYALFLTPSPSLIPVNMLSLSLSRYHIPFLTRGWGFREAGGAVEMSQVVLVCLHSQLIVASSPPVRPSLLCLLILWLSNDVFCVSVFDNLCKNWLKKLQKKKSNGALGMVVYYCVFISIYLLN